MLIVSLPDLSRRDSYHLPDPSHPRQQPRDPKAHETGQGPGHRELNQMRGRYIAPGEGDADQNRRGNDEDRISPPDQSRPDGAQSLEPVLEGCTKARMKPQATKGSQNA